MNLLSLSYNQRSYLDKENVEIVFSVQEMEAWSKKVHLQAYIMFQTKFAGV